MHNPPLLSLFQNSFLRTSNSKLISNLLVQYSHQSLTISNWRLPNLKKKSSFVKSPNMSSLMRTNNSIMANYLTRNPNTLKVILLKRQCYATTYFNGSDIRLFQEKKKVHSCPHSFSVSSINSLLVVSSYIHLCSHSLRTATTAFFLRSIWESSLTIILLSYKSNISPANRHSVHYQTSKPRLLYYV